MIIIKIIKSSQNAMKSMKLKDLVHIEWNMSRIPNAKIYVSEKIENS